MCTTSISKKGLSPSHTAYRCPRLHGSCDNHRNPLLQSFPAQVWAAALVAVLEVVLMTVESEFPRIVQFLVHTVTEFSVDREQSHSQLVSDSRVGE